MGGCEVKLAASDVTIGSFFSLACTNTDESASTLLWLLAQRLCVNKSYRDRGGLVLMFFYVFAPRITSFTLV